MPFDAAPPAEVTARDRVIQLREFLMTIPENRFNMSIWGEPLRGGCGCIGGWADALFSTSGRDVSHVISLLGLTEAQGHELFGGRGVDMNASLSQAICVLDHYLLTGEIDWRVAE